jgi:hypothetical protein
MMRENHTRTIFPATAGASPNSITLAANSSFHETCTAGLRGGPAMWIVFYIATIASLSALGLAPNVVPETEDDDSDA